MKKLSIYFLLIFISLPAFSQSRQVLSSPDFPTIHLQLNQFDFERYNRSIVEKVVVIEEYSGEKEIIFNNNKWMLEWNFNKLQPEAVEGNVTFTLLEGTAIETAPSVDFHFSNWSSDNYVLLPAAAYNGNRFDSRRIAYSPKLMDPRDIGPDVHPIVSDVPRLDIGNGPSIIQERSGSMSTPAAGFYSPQKQLSFWLLFEQANQWGDYGLTIEENRDRSEAVISLTSPVVREKYKYRITDMRFPSDDKAPTLKAGDRVNFNFRMYFRPANKVQDLFDNFFEIRKDLAKSKENNFSVPLSACFEVQEEKFNSQNFIKKHGYYAVGMRDGKYPFLQDWQIGWTGGMISTYPLLFAGDETSKKNVVRTFDWLFPNGICPAGFFWDSGESKGDDFFWYGGDIRRPNTKNWHLIRKSGDAIYYIIKQMMLMEKQGIAVKDEWEIGTETVCDALVKLWEEQGQFGHFVDSETGKIAVGGSASGAIIPAGLVLAADYFKKPKYLDVAEASADYMYTHYVQNGITSGGPGDAMQNPDSESSYAMLESFMKLYEVTGEQKWLDRSEEMAKQFATWVMSYDYKFPETSTLGKLGVTTTGTVFANTQNKHGAPGICTHSGIALLKLYRATQNQKYMELLQDIVKHIPQNLSHPLRPIEGMKMGWMSERVSTTDWLEGIGELMYGSTWAETALMLTSIEIPGIYVQRDKSTFFVFDQVQVKKKSESKKSITLTVTNPTKAQAKIKVLSENEKERQLLFGENKLYNTLTIDLKPGESKDVVFKK